MNETIVRIAEGFWTTLLEMSPYLLLGFLVAGLLSVMISSDTVRRHLGKGRFWPVVKASFFGVPLPLCSCGVIPVAASLRKQGANRGATTAFLLSTPQTGVDSIFVTYSLLGLVFAVFRPVAAFVSGVMGGVAVALTEKDGEGISAPEPEAPCCCATRKKRNTLVHGLHHGFVTLPRDIAVSLFLGLVIAGAITAFVPSDYFVGGLGMGMGAKLVMLLIGIPIYVCATASIPIAAALIAIGISPGAALVFLMTGPATNAATITTLWKIIGRRAASVYLAAVALTALLSGVVLDLVYTAKGGTATPDMPWMLPEPVKLACAVILVAVLFRARFGGRTTSPEQTAVGVAVGAAGDSPEAP